MKIRDRSGMGFLALALGAVLCLSSCRDEQATGAAATETDTVLQWAILPVGSASNLLADWAGFRAAMEAETGLRVEFEVVADYEAMVQGFWDGAIDVAPVSNPLAIQLVDDQIAEVFATQNLVEGLERSVLLVKRGASVTLDESLNCSRTLRLGMGPPQSMSQTIVPMLELFAERGNEPEDCFALVSELSHGEVLAQLDDGAIDLGFTNSTNLSQIQQTNPDLAGRLTVIWQSTPIPASPIVWRTGLSREVRAEVMLFLMEYGRSGSEAQVAEAARVLAAINWRPPSPAANDHLNSVRAVLAARGP